MRTEAPRRRWTRRLGGLAPGGGVSVHAPKTERSRLVRFLEDLGVGLDCSMTRRRDFRFLF